MKNRLPEILLTKTPIIFKLRHTRYLHTTKCQYLVKDSSVNLMIFCWFIGKAEKCRAHRIVGIGNQFVD